MSELWKVGTYGDRVRQIQKILNRAGNYSGDIDGIFGPKTEAAVEAYQKKNKLTVDGVVGSETLKFMGIAVATDTPAPTPPPTPTQFCLGIDTSHYEPGVSWGAVATSKQFAMTKASEGIGGVDSLFKPYWPEMKQVGPRGAYHFLHPNLDPIKQAETFLSVVGELEDTDMGPILDWEVTGGVSPAAQQICAGKWLDYVEKKLGKKAILYANSSFFTENINNSDFHQYPTWMAQLTAHLKVPAGWPQPAFWQYSFTEHVVGVPNKVDASKFFGTTAQLKAFCLSQNVK